MWSSKFVFARAKYLIAALSVVEYCLCWADVKLDINTNRTEKKITLIGFDTCFSILSYVFLKNQEPRVKNQDKKNTKSLISFERAKADIFES